MAKEMGIKRFSLHVHPFVDAYIKRGFFSIARRWKLHYSMGISIIPNQSLPFLGYQFYNAKGEEIDMREEHENIWKIPFFHPTPSSSRAEKLHSLSEIRTTVSPNFCTFSLRISYNFVEQKFLTIWLQDYCTLTEEQLQ